MFAFLRRAHRGFVESHRLAAPASTLLLMTIFALLLGLVTRVTFAKPVVSQIKSQVSESVSPGGLIEVNVPGEASQRFSAYLPGLTKHRTQLVYNPETGSHEGEVKVPETAPKQGYCTLRIVNGLPDEQDQRIRLTPSMATPGS